MDKYINKYKIRIETDKYIKEYIITNRIDAVMYYIELKKEGKKPVITLFPVIIPQYEAIRR